MHQLHDGEKAIQLGRSLKTVLDSQECARARAEWVSKGIISQCGNKAVGKIEQVAKDLEVLEEYAHIPEAAIEKLPTLGKGEFCLSGDWVKETTFVKVGKVQTTHLGMTPEVIPPSPKELRTVIESLQKTLPEIIEKVKPTVVSTAEIEAKIKRELETKFKAETEAIRKTADEKAERKYKVKIDAMQEQLEKLSGNKRCSLLHLSRTPLNIQ